MLNLSPSAYDTVEEMISAVNSNDVEGILMDRYTAFYYRRWDKLVSLFTVREIEVQKKLSIIFAKELEGLVNCLTVIRPAIDSAVKDITAAYKVCTDSQSYSSVSRPS